MPEDNDHPRPAGEESTERISARASQPQHDANTAAWGSSSPWAHGSSSPAGGPTPPGMWQSESPAERTQAMSASPADFSAFTGQTQQTQSFTPNPQASSAWSGSLGQSGHHPDFQADSGKTAQRRGLVRGGIAAGVAVGLLLLIYIADIAFSSGTVPRGTVVADVQIGGLDKAAAERKLRDHLSPGLAKPVVLDFGGQQASLNPEKAGLRMDWAATVASAGEQPLNPFTRVSSLFTTREVTPISSGDRGQLSTALEQLKPQLDRAPAEGTIRFDGATPIAVDPVRGRTVDISGAAEAVLAGWASHKPVPIPFTEQPVSTTADGVHRALEEVAKPAVSGPVTVLGEGKQATITPDAVAGALRFEPDGKGGLKSTVDNKAIVAAVEPQLRDTIKPGQDAQIVFENNAPVVHPSVDGHGVDWNKSFEHLMDVLKQHGNHSMPAIYANQPAKFTTDQANALGIKEPISEFTTGGFEPASGVNIRRVAEQVNGAIVKPGEVFSLNGYTGPRGVPQGYVESGVIEDGHPARAVGGGISQFATTLFNAEYFAGAKDVEHKEHSQYIKRYPAGREATVFQNPDGKSVIDVKFKNVSNTGIMITTQWTPSSITVRFWGTKQVDVTSQTGPQTDPTPPQPITIPPGQPCSPSKGEPGFTVTDTRTIRNRETGQVTVERPSKTRYDPHPIINCPAGPPPPG